MSPEKNRYVIRKSVEGIRDVRIPGITKPFEQMTISELVQLRPSAAVSDSYEVNAVTDNASITTSAMLNEISKIRDVKTLQAKAKTKKISSLEIDIK